MSLRASLIATISLGTPLAAAPASAAVFGFLAEANKLEARSKSHTLTRDGITVTARGFYGSSEILAYLDGGNAGLGVCKVLSGSSAIRPTTTTSPPASG